VNGDEVEGEDGAPIHGYRKFYCFSTHFLILFKFYLKLGLKLIKINWKILFNITHKKTGKFYLILYVKINNNYRERIKKIILFIIEIFLANSEFYKELNLK
jgi:hypothetical protein